MVNKFKRFFKSLGGKHSSSSSSSSNQSTATLAAVTSQQFVSGPYGSSSSELEHCGAGSTSRNVWVSNWDDNFQSDAGRDRRLYEGRYYRLGCAPRQDPQTRCRMHHMFRSSDYQSIDEAERH
ncbi:hypothetical protein JG688_00011572 [Phytophthora aleatoria]|uniref:Uncharacterized protein n=1 Tax=Phytophthora aleatoria TaxID=2496075 RepID=A0A8J5J3W5_9STRA|nr:hypothetical protein JG688_00011572 [Phytophthora aleatoria]